jgi:hypothetical protein
MNGFACLLVVGGVWACVIWMVARHQRGCRKIEEE